MVFALLAQFSLDQNDPCKNNFKTEIIIFSPHLVLKRSLNKRMHFNLVGLPTAVTAP